MTTGRGFESSSEIRTNKKRQTAQEREDKKKYELGKRRASKKRIGKNKLSVH